MSLKYTSPMLFSALLICCLLTTTAYATPSAVAVTPQQIQQQKQQEQQQKQAKATQQQHVPRSDDEILAYNGFDIILSGFAGFGFKGEAKEHFFHTYGGISGGLNVALGYRFLDGYLGIYEDIGYNDITTDDNVKNDYIVSFLTTFRAFLRTGRFEFVIGFGIGPLIANYENTQKPDINNFMYTIWATKLDFTISYYFTKHITFGFTLQPLFVNSGHVDHLEQFPSGAWNTGFVLGSSWLESPPFENLINLGCSIGYRF